MNTLAGLFVGAVRLVRRHQTDEGSVAAGSTTVGEPGQDDQDGGVPHDVPRRNAEDDEHVPMSADGRYHSRSVEVVSV